MAEFAKWWLVQKIVRLTDVTKRVLEKILMVGS